MYTFSTVACPSVDSIDYGTIMYSSDPNIADHFAAGTTVSYECIDNYRLSGMESRQCKNDMEWDGVAPTCEREYSSEI